MTQVFLPTELEGLLQSVSQHALAGTLMSASITVAPNEEKTGTFVVDYAVGVRIGTKRAMIVVQTQSQLEECYGEPRPARPWVPPLMIDPFSLPSPKKA